VGLVLLVSACTCLNEARECEVADLDESDLAEAAIRIEAASWTQLVAEAKPTLTWQRRNMLWVEEDQTHPDELRFVLDHAYLVEHKDGTVRWTLLRDESDGPYRSSPGEWPRTEVSVSRERPRHDRGRGDYAVVMARSREGDVLFELGWEAGPWGMGNHVAGRQIYVLRERGGQWRLIGEGPGWYSGRGGGTYHIESEARNVTWTGDTDAPVRIDFTETLMQYPDEEPRPRVVTRQAGRIAGHLPARYEKLGQPYLVSGRDDTFERMVDRLSAWTRDSFHAAKGKQWLTFDKATIRQMWRRQLLRLNPDLPMAARIPRGKRVRILTDRQAQAVLEGMGCQDAP